MDTTVLDDAHGYWFGDLPDAFSFPHDRFPIWFGGGPDVDAEIAARFGAAVEEAGTADIDLAALSPDQQVGLIVLLDQFTRNIYRDSAEAYRFDARARAHAEGIAAMGLDRLRLVERVFAILPFGHSENLADQDRALALFAAHVDPFVPQGNRFYDAGRVQSRNYRDIIARFGRFPHRNALLGRDTTEEEAAFLATTSMSPF